MKRYAFWGITLLTAVVFVAGCARKPESVFSSLKDPETVAQLNHFLAEKEAQAYAATNGLPPGIKDFFSELKCGDWLAASNTFSEMAQEQGAHYGPSSPGVTWLARISESFWALAGKIGLKKPLKNTTRLHGTPWEAVKEVYGACDQFIVGDEKYAAAFGRDISASIPPGSIYFGGTDPGRFLVTAMTKSQVHADPFFTLTQNALADTAYLDYLRSMYGGQIRIPTAADSQQAFEDYTSDASRRQAAGQLKPGEDVVVSGGRVQISGHIAVMQINALLAKVIFENNSNREFYLEESFPLDWMYPQLEPHGLIFKLDRQPMSRLPEDIVRNDHEYWAKYARPLVGDWLDDKTSVAEIAAFAEKTFQRGDLTGFKGDPRFIQNGYAHKMFSKLRSSIGGLYAWRASHAVDATDKAQMEQEADFAFRQAWALCPYSPEVTYRYVNFLMAVQRTADALKIAETAAALPQVNGQDHGQLAELVKQLRNPRNPNPVSNP